MMTPTLPRSVDLSPRQRVAAISAVCLAALTLGCNERHRGALLSVAAGAELAATGSRVAVRVPVTSPRATVMASVPEAASGADVTDWATAFPGRSLDAADGAVPVEVGREPVYVLDGDTSLPAPIQAEASPFGFHPAVGETRTDPSRYGAAREIGVRWHRGLYAYWLLIQPTQDDIDRGVFRWEQNDREWGSVPEGMAILGNIGLPERLEPVPGKDPRDPMSWTWRLNQPEAAYLRFVKAVVERYDGDGVDDMPGLRLPIRTWQVDNEPDAFVSGSWEDYAHLQEITYRAVKEACPEAKVLMGGQTGPVESGRTALGIQTFDRYYRPALERLGGRSVDGFDFHFYGDARLDWQGVRAQYERIRTALDALGHAQAEVWITEMGTYSGTPGDEQARLDPNDPATSLGLPPPARLPSQSEREQARDLVKRHVYPLALGVKKVFWAFGLVEGFKHDDGYFDHTGLVYDGEFDDDPPRGTPKLGYHAYRRMTATLDGADFSRATLLDLGPDVYAVRVPRGQGTVTVVWYDPPYRPAERLSAEDLARVRAALAAIGPSDPSTAEARLRALVDVIRLALDLGGPTLVDTWAPREDVEAADRKVRAGASDAPAAVDDLVRRGREAFE